MTCITLTCIEIAATNCNNTVGDFVVTSTEPCVHNPVVVINNGQPCGAGVPVPLEMTGCCGSVRWSAAQIQGPGTVTISDETANPTTMTTSVDGFYSGRGFCCRS